MWACNCHSSYSALSSSISLTTELFDFVTLGHIYPLAWILVHLNRPILEVINEYVCVESIVMDSLGSYRKQHSIDILLRLSRMNKIGSILSR